MSTKPKPLTSGATNDQVVAYLAELHDCMELHQERTDRNMADAETDRNRFWGRFDRKVSVGSLAAVGMLLLAIGALAVGVIRSGDNVNQRLENMEAAGVHRDARLDSMDSKISDLHDLAIQNHEIIVGADKAARGR